MKEIYSKNELKSIIVGFCAVVITFIAIIMIISHNQTVKNDNTNNFNIFANFRRTDGLNVGDIVRLSGVNIGRVTQTKLDENFNAILTLQIKEGIDIPNDSSAAIISFGLLGGKYIDIDVGGSSEMLKENDTIEFTQDSVVVEELLEKIITMGKSNKGVSHE